MCILERTFTSLSDRFVRFLFVSRSMESSNLERVSPTKILITAGGASLPPSLYILLSEATLLIRRKLCSYTPLITETKKLRNCKFVLGVRPGERRLIPVFVTRLQLQCFPEPFTPANGFS